MPQLLDISPKLPRAQYQEAGTSKFCPGCGHGMILKTLAFAIDDLELHERAVFGCDIGCCLLAWNYMNIDSVQCHHGRTTPVIYGVSRARPDTVGIAYMGDGGGLAIGSQHLVNAAVRNENMLIVLVNNTNYGMTGGQMAPTTLPGQITETTPYGRDVEVTGNPAKGAEMVAAIADPQKAFVERASITNLRKLRTTFKKALTNVAEGRGFSFVEVLSVCPLNWRTDNVKTWERIEEMESYFEVKNFLTPQGLEGVK